MKAARAICLLVAMLTSLALHAQPTPNMLNVTECGASGSQFQTTATTAAGSNTIVVADPGDFKFGQGVMVSGCNIKFGDGVLWGPKKEYVKSAPLKDLVQMRGYDGSLGGWTVYILDVMGGSPATFRWSDDLGRTWKQDKVPITGDWQKLSGGTEVKFGALDWESGYAATFSARDQLISTIDKIEGKTITLRDAAAQSATGAVVRHNDTGALQAAIDQGIREKRNVYFPPGTYRLARPLVVSNASAITIEGSDGVNCILDISEGKGACFELRDGREVNIRNFRMLGNTGFDARDQAGYLNLRGANNVWGFYLKPCHGIIVTQPQRVLVENCHASKMSGECFYCSGRSRTWNQPEPEQYTKSLTWLRCSVTDSARNAFNNNDMAENTSVLQCRIVDVGGCAWEGASRFVRFTGNYVRNAGTVAMGNVCSRDEQYEQLGTGQHIVSDNVFEGVTCYGGAAIRAAACATQVVITNNIFVNYNSSAIDISGITGPLDLPAGICTISGNMMDFTDITGKPASRTAIEISAPSVTVSDNQIYTRGAADPLVTAFKLHEPAINLNLHDNQVRNVGTGLTADRASAVVTEVKDERTFLCPGGRIPMERRQSPRYQGWHVVWLRGGKVTGQSVVESFDPETLQFRLTAPARMLVGDALEISPPSANWDIHSNSFSGCLTPVVLDGYGSPTSLLRDNVLIRGGASPVKEAVAVKGQYRWLGNQFVDYDEPGSATLSLYPDRLGQAPANLYQDNLFQRCALPVQEVRKGLWEACHGRGNAFLECGGKPAELTAATANIVPQVVKVEPPTPAVLRAAKPARPIKLDGDVSEWPWSDKARVAVLKQGADGAPYPGPKAFALAACDANALYVALKVTLPQGYTLKTGGGQYDGDGLELSFQSAVPQSPTPIFVNWGGAGGNWSPVAAGGVTAAQLDVIGKSVTYAAVKTADGWSCEWRIPLSVLGPKPQTVRKLLFNVGVFEPRIGQWVVWVGTGAEIYRVDRGGVIVLERP